LSISPLKSEEQYNPRLSKGKIRSIFHILFRTDSIINPYPFQQEMSIKELNIASNGDCPPSITVNIHRVSRDFNSTAPERWLMEYILDESRSNVSRYIPCQPYRIPCPSNNKAFDRWTFEDINDIQSVEFIVEPIYS